MAGTTRKAPTKKVKGFIAAIDYGSGELSDADGKFFTKLADAEKWVNESADTDNTYGGGDEVHIFAILPDGELRCCNLEKTGVKAILPTGYTE